MKRLLDLLGILLIGDGLLGMVHPRRHCRLWAIGPEPCRRLMEECAARPHLTRVASAAEVLLGFCIALEQEELGGLLERLRL